MKRLNKIVVSLVLCCVAVSATSGWKTSRAEEADFTMNAAEYNIRASEIQAIPGALTIDPQSPYIRGQADFGTNEIEGEWGGQFFYHGGMGDCWSFTVDFGSYNVTKISYYHYGVPQKATVFEIYADDILLGTGRSPGSTDGWVDNGSRYDLCGYSEIWLDKPVASEPERLVVWA